MPKVFIGVGSNLGDRACFLELAKKELLSVAGLTDLRCSSVYETEPVDGAEGQPRFWNAVWSFETELTPETLLKKLNGIETKAGRERRTPKEARVLDLDILFCGNQVIKKTNLTIPHPRLHERAFVLVPFCDLEPDFVHPVLKKTVKILLNELSAKGKAQSAKWVL